MWTYSSKDSLNSKENVDYKDILMSVNQLDIWRWILGKYVEEAKFFTNELRGDKHAGAWLEWKGQYLRLQDYADRRFHGMNIFDAVMYKYGLTLQMACKKIRYECVRSPLTRKVEIRNPSKFKFQLSSTPKLTSNGELRFTEADKEFWSRLNINKEDLENEVFSTYSYSYNSKKYPNRIFTSFPQDLSYTYVFPSGRKKIYHPERVGVTKWIADINERDIWFRDYPIRSDILIVTKSYIDGKLIWKSTEHNVEALQNEGCFPSVSDITRWNNTYSHIFFLYDIDVAGIRASKKIVEYCNSIYEGKFSSLFLPFHLYEQYLITDCKEIVTKLGYSELQSYLNYTIDEKLVEYSI